MKKYRREVKYIIIFFAFLTVATFLTNMDQRIVATRAVPNSYEIKNAKPKLVTHELRRKLASESEVSASSIMKEFFCGLREKNNVADYAQDKVLINFSTCLDEMKNIESFNIENKRNGFKAHIFVIEDNKFKTDFVQLSPGENIIQIEVVLKNGQKNLDSFEIHFVHNSKQ